LLWLVRHAVRHFFWVAGIEEKHFDSLVRHFVAHVIPALPSKHAAYAFWNMLEHWDGGVWWQLSASRALLMHARVAGLKGCGASVVVVLVVVVVVVVLAVVPVICACTVPWRSTMPVRTPTTAIFDGRDMGSLSLRRRAISPAGRASRDVVGTPGQLIRTS
jgi:hypothetical protein